MWWFKSKPRKHVSFLDVAPEGLFDLHLHVLPGVDDGARDMDESSAILDGLAALGFAKVAATPHFDPRIGEPSAAEQAALIAELDMKRRGASPLVVVGAETIFDDAFLKREIEGAVPGIDRQPTYLVELGFLPGGLSPGVMERLFRFQASKKQLLLAHPERIPGIQRDLDKEDVLRGAGVLLQLDVMSLTGRYGAGARRTAEQMLERRSFDLASTDLHRLDDMAMLTASLDALASRGDEQFRRLFSTNPGLVLDGKVEEIFQYA
jgi:protein-tyrosine phosphatase